MKSEKATVQARIEEILAIRLRGAMHADIVRHATENNWGIGLRQLREYIARTDDLLERTLEKDRQKLLNLQLARREVLYAHAFQAGDFSTAKAVLQDQATLLGLYPAKKQEITGANGGPIVAEVGMSDAELQNAITGILAALGETSSGTASSPEADPDGFTLE